MRRIVVDMQNALFTDAIAAALRNFDSDFEVFESELPQKTAELCGDVRADVLIAEVTSCTPWTFEDRMKTRSELKKICPELDSLNIGGAKLCSPWTKTTKRTLRTGCAVQKKTD